MSTTDTAAPALKEIFNAERLQHIAREMSAVYPAFKAKAFLKHAQDGLAELSVMQRMARVSESLHAVLPLDYEDSLDVLRELAPRLNSGFVSMCLPHYVASYGGHAFDTSMDALKYFTTFGSSEFAIRHFCAAIWNAHWNGCTTGPATRTTTSDDSPAKAAALACLGRFGWTRFRPIHSWPPGYWID
jgi:3-methyladenine DNA glycosylase AlkC